MKNRIVIENTVKKYYHSAIACDKENYILDLLKNSGLSPKKISCARNCIETEYINGLTLSQLIDNNENSLEMIIAKLVEWTDNFNAITKNIVLDDMNLKNFIFSNGKIYGIDFESWHYGDSSENYSALLAAVKTAYFRDEKAKEMLCRHMESLVGSIDNAVLKNKTDKTHLRRRVIKRIRNTDCVIIAGGKSSRMGSPKGLLEYMGYTFVDHIIFNTSVFDRQYISANNELYDNFGCKIVKDNYTDIGPMGAIHAALTESEKEYVFFIPCDMPFVTEESIFYLFDKGDINADAVIFTAEGKVCPTVGIYSKSILPQLEKQIESGNYKMMKLLDSVKTQYIEAPLPQQFKNINTPQDYEKIK